jgi:HPt (histidine-containing phosphotransfer) domain-containing protein
MNIINKSILSELESHISHEKFLRNIQTFMAYLPEQIRVLDALLLAGDAGAIADKAHTLKGTCGQFGAMRLHELFKTIERCALDHNVRDIQMIVRALPYEFQLVQELISLSYMHAEEPAGLVPPVATPAA